MSIIDRNRQNLEAARAKYQFNQQREEEAKALTDKPAVSMGYDPASGRYQIARLGENAMPVNLITNGAIGTGDRVTVKGGKFLDGMPRPPAVDEPLKKEPATKISADMLLSRTEGSNRVFYVQRKANLDKLASIPLQIPVTPPVLPPDGLPNRPGVYGWTVFYIRSGSGTGFAPGLPTTGGFSATGFSFSPGARSSSNLWYSISLYQPGVRFEYRNTNGTITISQAYVVSSLDLINGSFSQDQFYESTYFIWRFSVLGHRTGLPDIGNDFEVATHFTKNAPPPGAVIGSNFYRAEDRVGTAPQPTDPYMSGLTLFPVAYDNSSWQLFKYENISGNGIPDPIVPPAAPQSDNAFDCYISATKPKTSYVLIRDRVTAADTTMRVQYFQVASKITSLAAPEKKDWRSSRVSPNPSPPSDPDACKNQYRGGSPTFDPVNDCLSIAKNKLFQITDSKGRAFDSSDYSLLTTKPSPAVIQLKTLRSLPSSCSTAPNPGKKKRYTLPQLKEAGLEIRGIAPIFT